VSRPAVATRPVAQRRPASADHSLPFPAPVSRLRRSWQALDAPPGPRRVPGTVLVSIVALAIGLGASWLSTRHGANLDYSDAQSHLTIARRILESKSPGLQQLGTVWLPAPHLLLLPLVQSTWLWHTGWAACVLGTLCLASSTASLYRIAARIGLQRAGRLITLVALLANPSLLYMYTTALTEPVLLAGLLGCVAGLARWATVRRTPSGGELAVFAGVPAAVAVLSRYEGWALLLGGTAFVLITGLRNGKGLGWSARAAASFVSVPSIAVLWWLAYNWGTYHNALEFMFGPYSAYAQQKNLYGSGLLPTKGNFGLALSTYDWSVLECAGAVLLGAALGGLAVLIWDNGLSDRSMIVALLAISYSFSLASLYLGQTAIDNDHSLPANWWNSRFALSAMPVLALLAGILLQRWARKKVVGLSLIAVFLVAIGMQDAWFLQDLTGRSAVLAEARMSRQSTVGARAAGRWLAGHYHGGGILMDESARGNAILPYIGIDLAQYDIRASGGSFVAALADPGAYDEWVLANVPVANGGLDSGPNDLVEAALAANLQTAAQYRMVFRSGDHAVYQRIGAGP